MIDPAPEVLTLKEAAALLRISETTLRDRAKRGIVPGAKIGSWRFSRSALLALLSGHGNPVGFPFPGGSRGQARSGEPERGGQRRRRRA